MHASRGQSRAPLVMDLLMGQRTEVDPRLQGIDRIHAERPQKGVIANLSAWVLWIGPLFVVASMMVGQVPPVPIVAELVILYFAYAVIVRVVTGMREPHTLKGILRDVREEAQYRGLLRISLGVLILGSLLRLIGAALAAIDSLGQPGILAQYGMREMTPLWIFAQGVSSLGGLLDFTAMVGLFFAGIRVARRYVQGRRNTFRMMKRFGSKNGILSAILGGVSVSILEGEESITFDGDDVIIDPVPIPVRKIFDQLEDNLTKYNLDDLMVRVDSTVDRIILTPSDEETRVRRATLRKSNGLFLSLSDEGSSDEEVLGHTNGESGGDQ